MKTLLFITICILLSSCASKPYRFQYHSEPELLKYHKSYMDHYKDSEKLKHNYGMLMYFQAFDSKVVAYCTVRDEVGQRELVFNSRIWNKNPYKKEKMFDQAMTDCVYEKARNGKIIYKTRMKFLRYH